MNQESPLNPVDHTEGRSTGPVPDGERVEIADVEGDGLRKFHTDFPADAEVEEADDTEGHLSGALGPRKRDGDS